MDKKEQDLREVYGDEFVDELKRMAQEADSEYSEEEYNEDIKPTLYSKIYSLREKVLRFREKYPISYYVSGVIDTVLVLLVLKYFNLL